MNCIVYLLLININYLNIVDRNMILIILIKLFMKFKKLTKLFFLKYNIKIYKYIDLNYEIYRIFLINFLK